MWKIEALVSLQTRVYIFLEGLKYLYKIRLFQVFQQDEGYSFQRPGIPKAQLIAVISELFPSEGKIFIHFGKLQLSKKKEKDASTKKKKRKTRRGGRQEEEDKKKKRKQKPRRRTNQENDEEKDDD